MSQAFRDALEQRLNRPHRHLNLWLAYFYWTPGLWWFRVFGWGVVWKRLTQHRELFSERECHHGMRIGTWSFGWLSRRSNWK